MGISRRRLLQAGAVGGIGLATAALIGCGDDDDDDAPPAATAAATQAPAATAAATEAPAATATAAAAATQAPAATAAAARATQAPAATAAPSTVAQEARAGGGLRGEPRMGGYHQIAGSSSPLNLDPLAGLDHNLKAPAAGVYSQLFKQQAANFENHPNGDMAGDLAETWEITPDGLTLTIQLQPNAKFTAPVNRNVDSEDVHYTYNRFTGKGPTDLPEPSPNRSELGYIDSVTTPDAATVVMHMAAPNARALYGLANYFNLLIMPKETGTAFDPLETMVGSGPWIFDGWEPEVNFRLKRNPEWFGGGGQQPYLDGVETSYIGSGANQVVQFQAGNLDITTRFAGDDVLQLGSDVPDALILPKKSLGHSYFAFGEPRWTAPWGDKRVRQAISLGFDRASMVEAAYNVRALDEAGFAMSEKVSWHNSMPAGFAGQSVDPRTDPEGSGKYIRYDVAEAKKLLAAAGFADGFDATYSYTPIYSSAWKLEAEVVPQLMLDLGINFQSTIPDYGSVFLPQTIRGQFDGVAHVLNVYPDIGDFLNEMYNPEANINTSRVDQPHIFEKIVDINQTIDVEERNQKIRDIQTLLTEEMWYVSGVGWQISWEAYRSWVNVPDAHFFGRGGGGFTGLYEQLWLEK